VGAVAVQGEPGGADRGGGGDGVALDAGDLDEPPDGVAGEPEVGSIAISAAFSTCRGVPPSTAHSPPAAIAQAEPTSAWHPPSAPEMDALRLNSEPSAAAVSR
jgi:hypothetical protein